MIGQNLRVASGPELTICPIDEVDGRWVLSGFEEPKRG